jgi:hypothetical protein
MLRLSNTTRGATHQRARILDKLLFYPHFLSARSAGQATSGTAERRSKSKIEDFYRGGAFPSEITFRRISFRQKENTMVPPSIAVRWPHEAYCHSGTFLVGAS